MTLDTEPESVPAQRRSRSSAWARVPAARLAYELATNFRLPGRDDPTPTYRRLAWATGWATVLGLGGLVVGVQAAFALFTDTAWWYEPAVVVIGAAGIACTVCALTSLHRKRLPLLLLSLASVALAVGLKLSA